MHAVLKLYYFEIARNYAAKQYIYIVDWLRSAKIKLAKFFHQTRTDMMLFDPRGPLAKQIPRHPLRLRNGEVRQVLQAKQATEPTKRD